MIDNILDYLRVGLYLLLALVCFALYQAWQTDHPEPVTPPISKAQSALPQMMESTAPNIPQAAAPAATTSPVETAQTTKQTPNNRIIHVSTDVLAVEIDTLGGDIIQSKFLDYPENLQTNAPYILLNHDLKTEYIAQSGLLSAEGPDTTKAKALYKPEKLQYTLEPGQKDLEVKLLWQNEKGLFVTKTLTFHRNDYEIDVAYQINNQTSHPWSGNQYNQLLRTDSRLRMEKAFLI